MIFSHRMLLIIICIIPLSIFGQKPNIQGSDYLFTPVVTLGATDVKNQSKSNTCWSYATNSFLESELIRMGKTDIDLSELFIVRNMYVEKADKFVRMMGKTQFAAGGQAHDVMHAIKTYGIVPQSVYAGQQPLFNHMAWDDSLRAYLDTLVKLPDGRLNLTWKSQFLQKLDVFTGVAPTQFVYKGQPFTPLSFAVELGIKPDDYVEIGSFTHHPFYQPFVIECPDNWAWTPIYNVPLADMEAITDYALARGFTVNWDADVSEKYFSHKNGIAIVPKNIEDLTFKKPMEEASITPELRQSAFDDLTTQDDHLMHIVGVSKDQTGKKFYNVKNSWGMERNECGGYLYVSKAYFNYKTIMIMVHKNAIPKRIARKLGIK